MRFSRLVATGLVLVAAQITASAAEVAVLRNGFSISFLRKQQTGDMTRLFTASGYMDVPTADIASFEHEEAPPAPQPEAAPQPATASVPAQPSQPNLQPASVVPVSATAGVQPAPTKASPAEIDQAVVEAAGRHQLDPDFVRSVIKAESNFQPHAVSRKGAQGLMQLMPQTAAMLGVKDAFDAKANVEAGTAHLSALLDLYHNDAIKALAAYNAGAHRVQQYHGVPPYQETRAYVARIVKDFNAKKRAQMKANAVPNKTASKTPAKGGAATAASGAKKKAATPRPQQASVPKPAKRA